MNDQEKLQAIANEAHAFQQLFQSLHLATCNLEGVPEASYATFVKHDNKFYVYVSELAKHCNNLRDNKRCSAMFIESEEKAQHPFARKRLVLQCAAQEIARENNQFDSILALFHEKFGKFIEVIGELTDFHLYELTPVSGNYVAGFAKAYRLTGEHLLEAVHRTESGHFTRSDEVKEKMAAFLDSE